MRNLAVDGVSWEPRSFTDLRHSQVSPGSLRTFGSSGAIAGFAGTAVCGFSARPAEGQQVGSSAELAWLVEDSEDRTNLAVASGGPDR